MKFFKSVWVFADRGGEDVVDETELLKTIPNRNILEVIFRLVDKNADGVISYEEALIEFKKQTGSEPGLAPLIDAEIERYLQDQKLGKIRGLSQYHEDIDPIMFVAADHAQKTVKADANNEKDPDVYDWHQLDLMCSWNLNNCTDYCASMPTLCFETRKSTLPRWFGDSPRACECLLPHMFVCNWPCFLRSWACTTKKLFEPCSKVSKCGGIHGTSCGWCKSSGKALPGDANGPFSGECETPDWIHKVSQCPCEEMTHCDNIRGSTNCGWCNSTRTALPGTAEGPTDASACPKKNWEFENPARAPKSLIQYFNLKDMICRDRCSAITTCEEIYASNGCGWCADSSKSLHGSATGPKGGECSNWIWNALECPSKN
jgi:hypothetical protein